MRVLLLDYRGDYVSVTPKIPCLISQNLFSQTGFQFQLNTMKDSFLSVECTISIYDYDVSNDVFYPTGVTCSLYFLCSQFGNTCYCNSVLQALYFCRPFREKVLQYKQQQKNQKKETLLTCLADLFYSIATQKKKVGTIAPKKFIQRLRKENGRKL